MAQLKILFVCIGNSCRSPMAEAMARSLGGDRVVALSAGLSPAGFIAGPTLDTLERLGYPSDRLYSKGLDAIPDDDVDLVVSLLGGESFHVLPQGGSARHESWTIPDPFGEDDAFYLRVARDLEIRINELLSRELEGELLGE